MLSWVLENRKKKSNKKHPPYENAKQIASSGSVAKPQKRTTDDMLEHGLLLFQLKTTPLKYAKN
jgi:hypothetical protein